MLQRPYEELIVRAMLDPAFGAELVADAPRAALDAGYSLLIAESLAGLRAGSLAALATALHQRVYGAMPEHPLGAPHAFRLLTGGRTSSRRTSG